MTFACFLVGRFDLSITCILEALAKYLSGM